MLSQRGSRFCRNERRWVGNVDLGIFLVGQSLPVHITAGKLVHTAGTLRLSLPRAGSELSTHVCQTSSLTANRDPGAGLIAFDSPYSTKLPRWAWNTSPEQLLFPFLTACRVKVLSATITNQAQKHSESIIVITTTHQNALCPSLCVIWPQIQGDCAPKQDRYRTKH